MVSQKKKKKKNNNINQLYIFGDITTDPIIWGE